MVVTPRACHQDRPPQRGRPPRASALTDAVRYRMGGSLGSERFIRQYRMWRSEHGARTRDSQSVKKASKVGTAEIGFPGSPGDTPVHSLCPAESSVLWSLKEAEGACRGPEYRLDGVLREVAFNRPP